MNKYLEYDDVNLSEYYQLQLWLDDHGHGLAYLEWIFALAIKQSILICDDKQSSHH